MTPHVPEALSMHSSNDTTPHVAAATRTAVTDGQNGVLLGQGVASRGAAPLISLVGGKKAPAGTGPTAKLFGGCELREQASDGFSLSFFFFILFFFYEEPPFTFIRTWGEFSQVINSYLKLPFLKATPHSSPWRCPIHLANPPSLACGCRLLSPHP